MTAVSNTLAVAVTRAKKRGAKNAKFIAGVTLLGITVLFVLVYPVLPWYAPYAQHLDVAMQAPAFHGIHPLGTDNLGRDLGSRLALAGRVTLCIVAGIVIVNAIIGTVVGVMAGYFRGWLDTVIMGWADVQLALPVLLVLIALSAALGPSVWLMIIVLAVTYWVGYARVARSISLSLRTRDFVTYPEIQGARASWTMRKHIFPNAAVDMIIIASSDIGAVMVLAASFDFLGLGVQPPTPSWGLMISEGQKYFRQSPYLAVLPGILVFLVVFGANLVSQRFTAEGASPFKRRRSTSQQGSAQ